MSATISTEFQAIPPQTHTVMKVVIVDDHAAIIGMMAQVLESLEGFKVVGSAVDAESRMSICRAQTPDIVILDLVLPDVSGLSLLNELNEIRPKPRILIFTGNMSPAVMRGALAAGVLAVVEKMASLEIFIRAASLSGKSMTLTLISGLSEKAGTVMSG